MFSHVRIIRCAKVKSLNSVIVMSNLEKVYNCVSTDFFNRYELYIYNNNNVRYYNFTVKNLILRALLYNFF